MASSALPSMAAPYSGAVASSNTHPGKFAPGTKVQVGSHRVIVDRYLSEGGFAHVYVVRIPTSSGQMQPAVLKRVAVPDKEALASMRTEVETMKKLKGHTRIVTYIDSHASQLKAGGYEVFLLMEFCDGGGLIDFMNTRLKNRLTEPEILHIFSDAAEGVACMHYLKPPLLHRDLKVENILISSTGTSKIYKLCDFGSSAPPRPAATSAAEGRLIEDDVQKHTTLQYRSPEMVDVYQKRPIDEKSDIWALGVLLYKLCYYTTPFEQQGTNAILNASFKYPGYPKFSDRLKKLIASMLTLDPRSRPNIYQVLVEVCAMRGREVPVKDIYSTRTQSEARKQQKLPEDSRDVSTPPLIGATRTEPEQVRQALPEVTPMRRGRPASSVQPAAVAKPQELSARERDPFAALDSPSFVTRSKAVDDLSARFPTAEQFSLLQDKRSSFHFQTQAENRAESNSLATNALADQVFSAKPTTTEQPMGTAASAVARAASLRETKRSSSPLIRPVQKPSIEKPLPEKPKMVSTGTMTSAPSSPVESKAPKQAPKSFYANKPIWRVPPPKPNKFALDLEAKNQETGSDSDVQLKPTPHMEDDLSDSELMPEQLGAPTSASSRPSLDGIRPPLLDLPSNTTRSRSADERALSPIRSEASRDSNFAMDSSLNLSRGRQSASNGEELLKTKLATTELGDNQGPQDFQPDNEVEAHRHDYDAPYSLDATRDAVVPPASKTMLAGKFGTAFRRFQAGGSDREKGASNVSTALNEQLPSADAQDLSGPNVLDDGSSDEERDLTPEARRELERRRLSLEEKRVANAAANYRQQLMNGSGPAKSAKSFVIQNRVANLLDESTRSAPIKKTAEGYGKYTASEQRTQSNEAAISQSTGPRPAARPNAPPKPVSLRTSGASTTGPRAIPDTELPTETSDVDLESDFSKRYPSLSLDAVESEVRQSGDYNRKPGKLKVVRDV